DRLIGGNPPGAADHRLVGERLGFGGLAFEEQPPDFWHRGGAGRIQAIAFFSRPDSVLVELQALLLDAAEDHRAKPAVPDRQRLVPIGSRSPVPQPQAAPPPPWHPGPSLIF